MLDPLLPLRFLLLVFAGLANQEQASVVEFLREENRVLREQIGKRRLRLTDSQRARLAVKAKALGRSVLAAVATIVAPDTLLRWHRMLVAAKWTHSSRNAREPGRPPVMSRIRELTIRMARENNRWGYTRIVGALRHLGHDVARTTVAKMLKSAGLEPAPERPTSWRTFLKAHAGQIAAADFFTVEVWTARGLVTHYVLVAIDIATRAIEVLGVTPNPDSSFMAQVARNLTDSVDGFLRAKRFLIVDRASIFDQGFRRILNGAGVRLVTTAVAAPNMNAFCERLVRTIKDECVSRMIFFGDGMLRRALAEFVSHYHEERPHQGIGNVVPMPAAEAMPSDGPVLRRQRLGGLLSYYHRKRRAG
ncbi:MAG TPA: integrase core domain-containing protein [Vicinamibacterales bacterium]|nr:integrase core domain-containing protein [Vicinamibacterales bacterium]